MILILGGRQSDFINSLAKEVTKLSSQQTKIVSSKALRDGLFLDSKIDYKGTKFIIGFCNKKRNSQDIQISLEVLQNTLLCLKKHGVDGKQIYLLGSESHLAEYFEICSPSIKRSILRNHYAFDSVVKRRVLEAVYPEINIINVPSISKDRTILKRFLRKLISIILAKIHSPKYQGILNENSLSDIVELLDDSKTSCVESRLISDSKAITIHKQWILKFIPDKALKFSTSVIKSNIDNQIIPIEHKKNKKDFHPKKDYFIVTPLNKIDINFYITYYNILNIINEFNLRWTICISPDIEKDVIDIIKTHPKISVVVEKFPSIYGGYNEFLRENLKNSGYYLPLSAGDILFLDGVKSGIKICESSNANIVFGSVFKHSQYIYRKQLMRWKIITGTHSFATGHSAACFIKISAHKKWGLYDLSYQLAADNDFFENIYADLADSITYSHRTLGYFPPGGISQSDYLKSFLEIFRSRVKNRSPIVKELLLLGIRLFKYRKFI